MSEALANWIYDHQVWASVLTVVLWFVVIGLCEYWSGAWRLKR